MNLLSLLKLSLLLSTLGAAGISGLISSTSGVGVDLGFLIPLFFSIDSIFRFEGLYTIFYITYFSFELFSNTPNRSKSSISKM